MNKPKGTWRDSILMRALSRFRITNNGEEE